MHRTTIGSKALLSLAGVLGAVWLGGCALDPADDVDEHVGEAEQQQIPPSDLGWRRYVLYQNSSAGPELAQILAIGRSTGGFTAGNEYWYVNKTILGELGTGNVYITYSDGLGTPSTPNYGSMQTFTVPTNPTGGWGTGWTTDPLSGLGKLYQNGSYSLRLQTSGSGSSTTVTAVAWYQVIPAGNTPANIAVSGTFGYTSGGYVSVGTGQSGYDINQSP